MQPSVSRCFLPSVALSGVLLASAATAAPLQVQVYNPSDKGIFPVSAELVSGEHEAILVDAQFGVADGEALVQMIRASGKQLKLIYISGGDPDYYFGLQPLVEAFPGVKVVASQRVVEHIEKTKDAKLGYWGPILGAQAPTRLAVPEVLNATTLTVDGEVLEVKEINTANAYLWAPSIRTVLGGVLVTAGQHVWMADSQTPAVRQAWVEALDGMLALKPQRVIPGHFLGAEPEGSRAVEFTRDYVLHYEQLLKQSTGSAQLIEQLKQDYPQLPVDDGLAIGARVNTGEMKW